MSKHDGSGGKDGLVFRHEEEHWSDCLFGLGHHDPLIDGAVSGRWWASPDRKVDRKRVRKLTLGEH